MKFIGRHSKKSNKLIMLARFIGFPLGFELLEGNIHDHDDPLSGGLTMFVGKWDTHCLRFGIGSHATLGYLVGIISIN
jgi:hypothetical protein